MDEENEFKIIANSKSYILATSEYVGTNAFKFMIRSELRGENKTTLFLLGIPDPAIVYARSINKSQDETKERLLHQASDSIAKYINENEWAEGAVYYGEYQISGTFEIGANKPKWEDGNWGQKVQF